MAETSEVQIRCEHCQEWFLAPLRFSSDQTFGTAALLGNSIQCHKCGKMTGCNKENMRVRSADGTWGFVGNDTT